LIVLDTSAVIAIVFDEPERSDFADILARNTEVVMSAASLYEASLVAAAKKRNPAASALVDKFMRDMKVQVIPFEHADVVGAREAYFDFGKGFHRAGLNFGDCFAYALSKSMNAPLLFKGNDFSRTDIVAAWKPAARQ
jgi:ribonuclease VapC